ncbi:MAG: hypothetical protein JWN53_1128 [Gemmatimonadetes bacterium]|nr:hypothetical protein [Gemmatimonadota bacterium]
MIRQQIDFTKAARLQQLRAELAPRLRAVCQAIPESQFEATIQRMAEIQWQLEMRGEDWRVA